VTDHELVIALCGHRGCKSTVGRVILEGNEVFWKATEPAPGDRAERWHDVTLT
jgi:hypothetical protein